MATNHLVNVPKLKGRENYNDWAFAVENYLILEGLSKCITELVEDSDAKAKAKIILTIDASLYIHVKEAKTTVELWHKLKTIFADSGFTRKISLLRSLISTRLVDCDSMSNYVNKIVEIGQKLSATGFNINDEWIGSLLLAGLPEKYSPMIMAIEHSGISITTDAIKTKLLDMETESGTSGSAFMSKSRWQHRRKFGEAVGHHGHGNGGNGMSKPNVNLHGSKKEIKCYKCKQVGHFKNKCPYNKQPVNNQEISNAFNVVFLNGQFNKEDWYIDSGASVHLTPNLDWIKNAVTKQDMQEIMVANKTKIPIRCTGEVDIITVVNNNKYDITVKNVFCAPELTTNLLSVSQLIKNGNTVEFGENCCRIYNQQKELVATADLINNLYKLNIVNSNKCFFSSAELVTDVVWHRRFGHINSTYLNKMKDGVVNGLSYAGNVKIEKKDCEVCCEAKQSRLPFSHKGNRASKLLEVVHADVCGPMEVKSIGGSKYFLILEDDYSRMGFVYFLKTKDEVFEFFKNFKCLVENQTNTRIKTLRTDNGGEFCSKDFEDFLRKNGIVHQKTNPYTPQQNGMVERLNRTIVEKAKCLLFDANLDSKFWAEAVNTAVYLRNRSLVTGTQEKTPYEIWNGMKPDVSHLKIFGSPVMVHVPKERRLKWDKKATKQVFIGYDENVKGYRVYNYDTKIVTTSRDVIMMENLEIKVKAKENEEIPVSVGENRNSKLEGRTLNNSDVEEIQEIDSEDVTDNAEVPDTPRRSERIPKPKDFEDYVTYMCTDGIDLDQEPITVKEALSRPDGEKWQCAMKEEIQSFEENDAWELVDVPDSNVIVECKWVFKRKINSENKVRYRARLVAKGFTQRHGIDYDETFSPVVRHSTLRLLLAMSVNLNLDIIHLDVTTAFLNGHLNENVYMMKPEGFQASNCENKVLKLKKAIYGLKQSSRAWYERVDKFLNNLDYKRSKYEPCLYVKIVDSSITIVAIYVDDFFVFSNDKVESNNLRNELGLKFKIKDLGQLKQCLGMRVNIDKTNNVITLDQEKYIDQLLKRFDMADCKTVTTPMEINLNLDKNNDLKVQLPFQQLIGSLMYLAILTRPDITYHVSYLSQFNNCYSDIHWKAAKRILKYLKETKNYGLKFVKGNTELEGFVDADWGGNLIDRKSYTGYCFKFSNSVISWESKKQNTVALSSTEAEYMAITEASKEAIYLRNLLFELTNNLNCITLYNDNQSAQKLALNPVLHKRTKHIDVRHHFIREAISDDLVTVKYLESNKMPADMLTKSLCSIKHYKFMSDLGIVKIL